MHPNKITLLLLIQACSLGFFPVTTGASETTTRMIDLAGEWGFALDPENKGIQEAYYTETFSESLTLPGCLQEQGFGNIPGPDTLWWRQDAVVPNKNPWMVDYHVEGNFKTQQFLLPDRHYIGVAWYNRELTIPKAWKGQRITLHLERCHWESQLWLNGQKIGADQSLATPHVYELGVLKPGTHRISLRIDNSEIINVGTNAHSVSEQTAGTWNGIVGKIELRASDPVWIDQVQIRPRAIDGMVAVNVRIGNLTGAAGRAQLSVDATGDSAQNQHDPAPIHLETGFSPERYTTLSFDYPMGPDLKLWDEFEPHLYRMSFALKADSGADRTARSFGLRHFEKIGTQFAINGNKTFLRGNTDCAVMPETGYAPMDVASWRKVWQTYKDFGLNMARFHSWCPPEAAFVAANEVGIYLAPECGEWSVVRKEPQKAFLRAESKRILETYGHHPSFVMLGLGNEFGGQKKFFEAVIEEWKAFDPDRLYTIKANSHTNPPNIDFEAVRGTGKNRSVKLRYQGGWPPRPQNTEFNTRPPQTSIDWREAVELKSYPLFQHETAQFCAYPNIDAELEKFTGYLKASYLEIAKEQLTERGMLDQVPDFVEASGKWQVELTSEEFEAAYRTPGLAGFHWLSLADFTGQTTAPVGFTDAFYDPKPYVDPAEVRRWNAPTVLLARMDQRIYTTEDAFKAGIELAHYGREELKLSDAVATLRTEGGKVLASWPLPDSTFSQGSAQPVDEIAMPLSGISSPAKLNLLVESPANQLANDWDIWVFPEAQESGVRGQGSGVRSQGAGVRSQGAGGRSQGSGDIHISDSFDVATLERLRGGETVLLLPKIGELSGDLPSCFTTYYWTSFGTKGGQSSANGILLDATHPLFRDFPTESHANWQWWDLLTRCQPMILDSYDREHPWPKAYRPLIQPIDSWKINRKLALVAEARVGPGKLLICSIDIENDLETRPATRQFRKSLFNYLQSPEFNPKTQIEPDAIAALFGPNDQPEVFNTENLPTDG